jgi:3'-phosphoadenosine 5'-phosphosulfate sulfotransferase (PAPS reductase)/FAD synthetase
MVSQDQRAQVLSYGGGVQSAAIAVLIQQGRLPRPDEVVMADTGRESRATWEYLRDVISPMLHVDVIPHSAARVDLYGTNGELLIPAYVKNGAGRLPTFCSSEWKRDPVLRWLRQKGYGRKRPVDIWLGISVDEMHRAKPGRREWAAHRFPLLMDVPLRRSDCLVLVAEAGLPEPPRSACWMCPHRSDQSWRWLRDNVPEEWQAAQDFEADIRKDNPERTLHKAGVPLGLVNLTERPRDGLWDQENCETGWCMT